MYYWPITDPYYPFNDGWNGCSILLTLANHASMLFSYSQDFPPPPNSLLAIIGPSISFTTDESQSVLSFLGSGGIVLLADDHGSGNTLLQNLNVSARFAGKPISDLYFYSKQLIYPLISTFAASPVTSNLKAVLMDRPSYIQVLNNRTVDGLAFSSPFSFIDAFGNGTLPVTEATQPFLVMASTEVGKGLLVLVSNPGVFMNGSIGLFNNTLLFRNLLNLGGRNLVLDVSHLSRAPLTDIRVAFKTDIDIIAQSLASTFLKALVTAILVLAFSGAFLRQMRSNRMRMKRPQRKPKPRKKKA